MNLFSLVGRLHSMVQSKIQIFEFILRIVGYRALLKRKIQRPSKKVHQIVKLNFTCNSVRKRIAMWVARWHNNNLYENFKYSTQSEMWNMCIANDGIYLILFQRYKYGKV